MTPRMHAIPWLSAFVGLLVVAFVLDSADERILFAFSENKMRCERIRFITQDLLNVITPD